MSDSDIPEPGESASTTPPPPPQSSSALPPPPSNTEGTGNPLPPPPPPLGAPAAPSPQAGAPNATVYSANGSYQYNARPDIGAAFSWAWAAMRRYMKDHVLSALVYFVLVIIGVVVYFSAFVGSLENIETQTVNGVKQTTADINFGVLLPAMAVVFLLMLAATVVGPALMLATSKMTADGEVPSVGAAWKRVPWGAVIGVLVLTYVCTLVGLILCIIPGVLFSLISPFVLVVAIEEGVGASDALSRTFDLAKQRFFLMAGTTILSGIVASAGSILFGVGVLFTAPLSYLFLLFMYRGMVGKSIAWWDPAR